MSRGAFRFFICSAMLSLTVWADPAEYRAQVDSFVSSMPLLKHTDAETHQYGLVVDLGAKYYLSDSFSTQFNPWMRSNFASKDSTQKLNFEPLEAQIQYKKRSRKIVLGFHRSPWEGTDIINPMDMVFAKNYLDPLSPSTRSAAGLFYSEDLGFVSLDLFYIPQQQKSLLPGNHSPWWPRQLYLPTDSTTQELRLPDRVAYEILSENELNTAFKNNVALRLQKNFGAVDLSLAGFEGMAQTPILTPQIVVTPLEVFPKEIFLLESPVRVKPTFYRHRVGAMAMTGLFGTTIIRLAAQHSQPVGDSRIIPGWSHQAVAEIEQTVNLRRSDITFLAELIYTKRQESGNIASLSSLLEKAAMVGFRWPFKENWSWISAYYQEFRYQSSFFHTELSRSHTDHLKSTVVLDYIGGTQNSPLGSFNKNAQGTYRLTFSY